MARASGSQTTATTVPKWQEDAAKAALARANQVAGLEFTPYYGADVAAMTPMQMSAMQGTNQAASAFGMPTTDLSMSMPVAQDFGGIQAYSSGSLYDQALAELKARNPEQYAAIQAQFGPASMPKKSVPTPAKPAKKSKSSGRNNALEAGRRAGATSGQGGDGGKVGAFVRDMFDGGGMGASGDKFKGTGISKILNTIGVKPAKPRAATPSPAPKPAPKPVTTSRRVAAPPPRPVRATVPTIGKGR
jgi:hypothetical protein